MIDKENFEVADWVEIDSLTRFQPGKWVKPKPKRPKHECKLPDYLPDDAEIGDFWECQCGKRWRLIVLGNTRIAARCLFDREERGADGSIYEPRRRWTGLFDA